MGIADQIWKMFKSSNILRLKCLACESLARAAYFCAAQSPHLVDVELLPFGLHVRPAKLRRRLQDRIDAISAAECGAIVLAFGLCGKATAGLAARAAPLVMPRAHDCVTLLLGGRERYQREFEAEPGTYWLTKDYIERGADTGMARSAGIDIGGDPQAMRDEYAAKYGKENADYLMEAMGAWQQHYRRAAFIDIGLGDSAAAETLARNEAARRGWAFENMRGDLGLLRRLLDGDWNEDFLIAQPGEEVAMTGDARIVMSAKDLDRNGVGITGL